MTEDITRLSYWFPKLVAAGLPVPRTTIIKATPEEMSDIFRISNEEEVTGSINSLVDRVKSAADEIGYPVFLRTDHTSGKHDWDNTCFVRCADDIRQHIFSITYFWEMVNMVAPPCDVWVVREFLPTIPYGKCTRYGNMPICREFRFFVDGGSISCVHPYWPQEALTKGVPVFDHEFNYESFSNLNLDGHEKELRKLASLAGAAVGGTWSVDILETLDGWYITDMAEANKSYHWEGCQNNPSARIVPKNKK